MTDTADGKGPRLTKNQKRRAKQKEQKKAGATNSTGSGSSISNGSALQLNGAQDHDDDREEFGAEEAVQIEYVSEGDLLAEADIPDEFRAQFEAVFKKFAKPEELAAKQEQATDSGADGVDGAGGAGGAASADQNGGGADGEEDEDGDGTNKPMSNKERKRRTRLSVAQLKQLVARPDVVEVHDVTASDPRLLVYLKAYRNTVPVPRHWCHKRRYLAGKRGIEKPPFQLPQFIADTGIAKLRSAVAELEESKTLKQKQREKMAPKMGRVNIDYQVLHDAFFKFQTKPSMTGHGDLYYEGKEFETKLKHKTPGTISQELKEALGMPEGAPPPWLFNMQRVGPPPSYPRLKIPGVNAPIPEGASYGTHPGGWGRPPVDEGGRPLWGGDLFGAGARQEALVPEEAIDKSYWGEMQILTIEPEDEQEAEAEPDVGADDQQSDLSGVATPSVGDGISTGFATGLETPETIELRKGRRGTESSTPQTLFQVLPQREVGVGGALVGSSHQYILPGAGGVDEDALRAQLEAQDVTVSESSLEDSKKRKRSDEVASKAKKQRDFKF